MKAAVLTQYGAPTLANFDEPSGDGVVVEVHAATINAVDIAIASGAHYLSPRSLPVVTGIEGAGVTPDGTRVYFSLPSSPFGSMAERSLVPRDHLIEIPDAVDFSAAATLGNAGLAGSMPLVEAAHLKPGESVVILGGTGVVGRIAVQAARALGAGSITVVGRNAEALDSTRALGATATVLADADDLTGAIREASGGGVDVILDYTWGEVAAAALHAGNQGVRSIQIGERAGANITIPAQLMRALGATVSGFMPIHYGQAAMREAYSRIGDWVAEGKVAIEYENLPLADVERAWAMASGARHKLVLVP
nr:zinc-binding dehydrogenase [Rhodococcus sp. (in: high G+C Gram-positive bacteria)]